MALDEQRKERQIPSVKQSLRQRLKDMEGGLPDEEAKKRYKEIVTNTAPFEFTPSDIEMLNNQVMTEMREEKEAAFQKERAEILAKRPEQEAANPLGARTGRATMKDGGKGIEALRQVAPDVVKRMGYQEGGEMGQQMDMLMGMEQEQTMLPDEKMEEDYVDYVVEETLSNEDRNYLIDALEKDDRLSVIFDQVIETAHEFSGSGTIEGPGTGKSDSIPARLSDGEFVITAKATEEIGADNLMSMMKDAEAAADERQMAYDGGMMREEKDVMVAPKEPVQQNINVTKSTVDNGAVMPRAQQSPIKAAIKEDMMLDPYQRHVRS